MIIHILRHAEAVERSPQIEEEHRYLTSRGRIKFRKAASAIKKLGVQPDFILTSPLARALQTADILAEGLGYEGELVLDARLSPGFEPKDLKLLLAEYPEAKEIVIVGHEPDFGKLAATLLKVEGSCSLKKGGMVTVKMDTKGKGAPQFVQLTTGSGKAVTSRSEAMERLQKG